MYFRQIEESDEQNFYNLCAEFYSSNATNRAYDQQIAEKTFKYLMAKHENLWGFLFFDAQTNVAIGYSLLTSYWCNEDGGNVVVLDELYVNPDFQHKGVGCKFLEWIYENFKEKATTITLEVLTTNTKAKNLYEKLGYKEDGFEVMSKKLN